MKLSVLAFLSLALISTTAMASRKGPGVLMYTCQIGDVPENGYVVKLYRGGFSGNVAEVYSYDNRQDTLVGRFNAGASDEELTTNYSTNLIHDRFILKVAKANQESGFEGFSHIDAILDNDVHLNKYLKCTRAGEPREGL